MAIRGRLLLAFEEAEMCTNDDERRALLTFVVVGAGPTGVEIAGAIAELASVDPRSRFSSDRPRFGQFGSD